MTKNRIGKALLLFVAVGALLVPARSEAEGPAYSLGVGFEVASGTYGTGIRTDSILVPLENALNHEGMAFKRGCLYR